MLKIMVAAAVLSFRLSFRFLSKRPQETITSHNLLADPQNADANHRDFRHSDAILSSQDA